MKFVLLLFLVLLPGAVFGSEKFDKMTPAEHLDFAKEALARGKSGSAITHLDAIPRESKEYLEGKKLSAKASAIGEEARRKQEKNNHKVEAAKLHIARKLFAATYQASLLDNGMDAYVNTQGKDNTTLKVKYILISRPLIHKLSQQGEYWQTLKDLGFKKVIFTDGFDSSWTLTP